MTTPFPPYASEVCTRDCSRTSLVSTNLPAEPEWSVSQYFANGTLHDELVILQHAQSQPLATTKSTGQRIGCPGALQSVRMWMAIFFLVCGCDIDDDTCSNDVEPIAGMQDDFPAR